MYQSMLRIVFIYNGKQCSKELKTNDRGNTKANPKVLKMSSTLSGIIQNLRTTAAVFIVVLTYPSLATAS